MENGPTGDDIRAQYLRAIGPDLGQLCHELRDDFDWLRRKWSEFQELYEKSQERIDLLSTAASNFFFFLKRLLYEDAMMHLCRLTDPPKTRLRAGDRENLTVMALKDLVSDPGFKASVQAKAEEARDKCTFARTWRNRRLAHTDLVSFREGHATTLPAVNSPDIAEALKSIGDLLILIESHYGAPHFLLGPDPWGAKSLVYYLERAERAISEERQRWFDLARGTAPKG